MKNILNNKLKRIWNGAYSSDNTFTIIEAKHGWQIIDFKELKEYRDLLFHLVWRDIKVLYAQTILGFLWAIFQPLIQIVVFTIIFGKVAKLSTEGIPYPLFATVAIIPWNYMSQAMTKSSESLIINQNMLGKIYFPRLLFPLTPILAKMIDFCISVSIIVAVLLYYRILPTWNLLLFPFFVLLMLSVTAGISFWSSALAIRFRDVRHVMPFVIRMAMFSAPVVYSASTIQHPYRIIYSVNPLVGIIEGFRSTLLGTPLSWEYILPGIITALVLLVSGAMYFKRMERVFVDVI